MSRIWMRVECRVMSRSLNSCPILQHQNAGQSIASSLLNLPELFTSTRQERRHVELNTRALVPPTAPHSSMQIHICARQQTLVADVRPLSRTFSLLGSRHDGPPRACATVWLVCLSVTTVTASWPRGLPRTSMQLAMRDPPESPPGSQMQCKLNLRAPNLEPNAVKRNGPLAPDRFGGAQDLIVECRAGRRRVAGERRIENQAVCAGPAGH